MHVPQLAIPFLIVSLLISLIVPIGFLIYFRRAYNISYKTILIGVGVWIIFTQVLEKLFHILIISTTPILHYPILFSFYGAVAAGIFEEGGRLLAFTKILKKKQEWQDGVAYGIGHGGIESLLLGALSSFQTILLYRLIQNGSFNQIKSHFSQQVLISLHAALALPAYTYLFIGLERVFAFFMQLVLSLIVLYSIRTRKWKYFVLAILFHVVFDFAPALYQTKKIGLPETEGIVAIFGIISLITVFKLKRLFITKKSRA